MSEGRFVVEGTQYALPNESWVRNVRIPSKDGSTVTLASPTMYAYKQGSDVTSTYFTGSANAVGDIITTPTSQNLVAKDRLLLTCFATINGITNQVAFRIWLVVGALGE